MLLPKIEAHVNALVTPPPPPPAISTTPTKTSPIGIPNEDITFSVNHGLNQIKVKKRKLSSDLGVSGKLFFFEKKLELEYFIFSDKLVWVYIEQFRCHQFTTCTTSPRVWLETRLASNAKEWSGWGLFTLYYESILLSYLFRSFQPWANNYLKLKKRLTTSTL